MVDDWVLGFRDLRIREVDRTVEIGRVMMIYRKVVGNDAAMVNYDFVLYFAR